MVDKYGRRIDYMRLSITDRCNLRCRYCMPGGTALLPAEELLTYPELLRVVQAAVGLGISKFKVTGGEPLVRPGSVDFICALKALPGVEQVTLTTNGLLLPPALPQLAQAGVDGVNVSLDTADAPAYRALTGVDGFAAAMAAIRAGVAAGLAIKVNCVLLPGCETHLLPLARLARELPLDVRFIEAMPIGAGAAFAGGPDRDAALALLRREWPDLHPVAERRGNGPAHYYASAALRGRLGMIDAVSHGFCARCNRVRLSAAGLLKPCLCYSAGADLRAVLRGGASEQDLQAALRSAIEDKPAAHCFARPEHITEQKTMNRIGG